MDSGESPDNASDTSGGTAVTIVADDVSFPEGAYVADAGHVDLTYRNEGRVEHTLVIQGVEGFKLTVAVHGDIDEGTVELDPGQYTVFCDIPDHREAGMEATLDVS